MSPLRTSRILFYFFLRLINRIFLEFTVHGCILWLFTQLVVVIIKRSRNGDGMILLSVTPLINNKNNMVGGRFNLCNGRDRISIEEMGSRMCEGQWLAPTLAGALVIWLSFWLMTLHCVSTHTNWLTFYFLLNLTKRWLMVGYISN